MKNNFMNKSGSLAFAAVLCVFGVFAANSSHAGFEWVAPPAGGSTAAPDKDSSAPASDSSDDGSQVVLPLPGSPAPLAAGAVPVPVTQEQILQLPPNYPGATESVIKTKNLSQQAGTAAPKAQAPVPLIPAQNQVPTANGLATSDRSVSPMPPKMPAPAPVAEAKIEAAPVPAQPKVIVQEDAPQAALYATPNAEKLVINPFPTGNKPIHAEASQPDMAPQADFSVFDGFGSDMPLALALQQIIPSGYAYSFDPSVNPGQPVSWDGGKPWDQVISGMVSPLNLESEIKGKVVHIRPKGQINKTTMAPESSQSEPQPMRRTNVKDPGEGKQTSTAEAVAAIETAAGDEKPAKAAAPKAAAATQEPKPLLKQIIGPAD
ncbi:MAG: hypothetical protein WBK77_05625 [Alphaproteobacteria bacterium]